MNNSLTRLIDGMVATLRNEVIPNVTGEFARGQAFGVIYMLNSIRLRADWSPAFVGEQLAAQRELSAKLAALEIDSTLLPDVPSVSGMTVRDLEKCRDDNDQKVCALLDWVEVRRGSLEPQMLAVLDAALAHYMHRQLKWEISTSAKPMFAEISSGSE